MIEIEIERLGINGEGVGSHQGLTIFVDGALPSERVQAEVFETKKNFARARLLKILKRSKDRVEPPCPLFGTCGGCQVMHLDYPAQLEMKRQRVVDALERVGKIFVPVPACIASPQPLAYRNKIQLPHVGGKLGLYARNTHDLVPIERCYIHCALGEEVFREANALLQRFSREGLKTVLIKTAVSTKQVLVILVTAQEKLPWLLPFAEALLKKVPEVKGVVQNINAAPGNTVLGKKFLPVAGQDNIEEVLCGLTLKVSPASFFQVNPRQAENLYQKALEFAELTGTESVLDAYCGVGSLSLLLAQQAKEVIGIECVEDAIADAKENAQKNGILNARFLCGQAEEEIGRLTKVDVAVLNPPRKGCDPVLLERLAHLALKRIVYISCDPATLARDLSLLIAKGYSVEGLQPFDMFPQTAHVECVAKLVKR